MSAEWKFGKFRNFAIFVALTWAASAWVIGFTFIVAGIGMEFGLRWIAQHFDGIWGPAAMNGGLWAFTVGSVAWINRSKSGACK